MDYDVPSDLAADPWFKVVDFLQQNWALLIPESDTVRVIFYGDTCGIFDELLFPSVAEAEDALRRNAFAKFSEDSEAQKIIRKPQGMFHRAEHPNGSIYSSGRLWH